MIPSRRNVLFKLATGGSLAFLFPFLVRNAMAMGSRLHTQGFHKIEGFVLHNNKPAQAGVTILPGDKITTGENSLAVFVVAQDAYLLRSNSQFEISAEKDTIPTLSLLAGKMLSVFGKGDKKVLLPTATMGIRGTAIYAEIESTRCYLCTCYGTVNIQSRSNPRIQETVVTKRHDAPRYIYAKGNELIVKAPIINHTEDELFMLEALVGRFPAFYDPETYQSGNYG